RPLHSRHGVGEEHRMIEHALSQFGEHVLKHRWPRADQVHPVVAEIAPDQRLRAQRSGVVEALRGIRELGHVKQCYKFRTLYHGSVSRLTRRRTSNEKPGSSGARDHDRDRPPQAGGAPYFAGAGFRTRRNPARPSTANTPAAVASSSASTSIGGL